MKKEELKQAIIDRICSHEVSYDHSKSGGHGGQKVNKKETKAELYFDIDKSDYLTDEQKELLARIYHNWVNKEWVLKMDCHEERYLHANQEKVTKHFHQVLDAILDGNEHHIFGRHDSKHHHKHKKHKH